MASVAPKRHDRPVDEEIQFQVTQPAAEGAPMRPSHDPRPFDVAVEEPQWRELPPAPPPARPRPAPPPAQQQDAPRPRVRWWLLALLLATLAAVGLQLLPSEPPPCGDSLFIPSTDGKPSCVDPALLQQSSK